MKLFFVSIFITIIVVLIFYNVRNYLQANKQWTSKKKFNHPKFGLLWYNKPIKSSKSGYYQGQYYFRPVNKTVDFMIESNKEHPDKIGLSFLSKLETEYSKLEDKINNEIALFHKTKVRDIQKVGQLEIVYIKKFRLINHTWELVYWLNDPISKSVLIQLENFEIINIRNNS